MSHSVRRHLSVEIDEYDEAIRRFIPAYDAMLDRVAAEVAPLGPALVLDLGAGTGALSRVILQRTGVRAIELIDVDSAMLGYARERLKPCGGRAAFHERSFDDPLPSCDAAVATISLHHVHDLEAKRMLYGRIHDALWAGGLLVTGDAMVPAAGPERDAIYAGWTAHMRSHGIEEPQVHLDAWAEEDTYFPLEVELEALTSVGFSAECVWREGPMAVVVGRKR